MPDDLSSLLSPIRERYERGNPDGRLWDPSLTPRDVPRLLAAVEAPPSALRRHRHTFTEHGSEICGGCLRPDCPDSPEAIITAALAGKETTDA